MFDPKLKEALSRVQKPGRYTGGEPGSVYKNKDEADVRFAFCFPDTYEVGMSFLGEKILYELLNSHENWWCERAFMPWLDMKAEMERLSLPLYTMESKDPLTAFDAVGFTLQYELSYTNILAMLDLAGIPFYSKDRDESCLLYTSCQYNSSPRVILSPCTVAVHTHDTHRYRLRLNRSGIHVLHTGILPECLYYHTGSKKSPVCFLEPAP